MFPTIATPQAPEFVREATRSSQGVWGIIPQERRKWVTRVLPLAQKVFENILYLRWLLFYTCARNKRKSNNFLIRTLAICIGGPLFELFELTRPALG